MKIISTRLFAQMQTLLREKIRTCDPHQMDYFIGLLNESNDIDHVAEVEREVFDHYSHLGQLFSTFESHWISVEDRMPQKNKPVLAIASSRYGSGKGIYQAVYTDKGWFSQSDYDGGVDHFLLYETTSHWACLPLFPKKDSKDPKEETKAGDK